MNAAKVTPMNKRERFITMVQTGLVVHYIKKANDNNTLGCHEGAIDHLELAYQVADNIPTNVSAAEAAKKFLDLVLMGITSEERKHQVGC